MKRSFQTWTVLAAAALCGQPVWSQAADPAPAILPTTCATPAIMLPGADREIAPAVPCSAQLPLTAVAQTAPAENTPPPAPISNDQMLGGDQFDKPLAADEPVVHPTDENGRSPDSCLTNTCTAPCGDSCSLIAGGQATFLWPNFNLPASNLFIANNVSGTTSTSSSDNSSVDSNMIVAPRIWLGVQGCRWGLVSRYWNASVWNNNFTPALPNLGTIGVSGSSRFSAYLADLEVQRLFYTACWSHRLGFGVRYGGVRLNSDVSSTTLTPDGSAFTSTTQNNQFFGTGLTLGLFSTRPLGCSCWSLYVAPRLSTLWGQSQGAAQATAFANDVNGSSGAIHGGIARGAENLFIAEFQWGAQWERQLVWSPARAFIRIGGEYQYWNTNGGSHRAEATSVAAVPSFTAASFANSPGGLLFNMIGFTFGAGIIY